MGFFKDVCNRCLIEELEEEVGTNMVLYTVDGFAYYGKLEWVSSDRLGHLVPGAGQDFVVVRHPDQTFSTQGAGADFEYFTLIDLCTVVAKTTGLTAIPPGFIFTPIPPVDDVDTL